MRRRCWLWSIVLIRGVYNIVVAHEAFHGLRNQRRGRVCNLAFKLDMSKAYDRVEWGFLESLMHCMGFNEVWIQRVMQCLSSVTYSVLVNGSLTTPFKPTRGLRLGDSLSPYLFLLVSEGLSRMFERAVERAEIQGYKMLKQCPTLTHMLFADDTLLFGKASIAEARKIIEVINKQSFR